MPSRRTKSLAAVVVTAAAAAGCNGPTPADIFLVQRTGTIPGAKATLRFIDDGHVSCNGGPAKEITSAQLITAREIRRELDGQKDEDVGLAEKHINLPPGRVTTLSYRVRSEKGTVAFSDTSAHQPQAFYRLAQLTREVAKGSCGLPR
ncbi:MAG TPA: hypothetical protein VNT55_25380 [Baekduia sp.]|nr:hypothetical protein [Baekduia sp.]